MTLLMFLSAAAVDLAFIVVSIVAESDEGHLVLQYHN